MNIDYKKARRISYWVLGVVGVIFLILFALGTFFMDYYPNIEQYFIEKRQQAYLDKINADKAILEEKYKNDSVGGKTPEETIDMLLDALKKNDVETASSYYIPELKEQALIDYKEELEKEGNLNRSIEYISNTRYKGTKGCDMKAERQGCGFRYKHVFDVETKTYFANGDVLIIPAGGSLDDYTEVILNKYTNVWKVSQL